MTGRSHHKPGILFGAVAAALILVLPDVNRVGFIACFLGPLCATWFEMRRRGMKLDLKQGAQIGFYSAFYGMVAAMAFDQLAKRFFHEQLWRFENLYRIPPLLAGKGMDAEGVSGWYILMAELTVMAIVAGALGAPSGLLGVKLFGRRVV